MCFWPSAYLKSILLSRWSSCYFLHPQALEGYIITWPLPLTSPEGQGKESELIVIALSLSLLVTPHSKEDLSKRGHRTACVKHITSDRTILRIENKRQKQNCNFTYSKIMKFYHQSQKHCLGQYTCPIKMIT